MALSKINPKLNVQEIFLNKHELKLICPFAMTVSGPSQSGKSEFLFDLVKFRNIMCTHNFERIIYCQSNSYSHKNQIYFQRLKEIFPKLEIHQGLPSLSELHLNMNNIPSLLLIDDLMDDILNSSAMVHLVTREVHNFNISTVFVLQNYFASGRYGKSLIKNCHYRVFFYNRIEMQELRTISFQIANSAHFLASNFNFLLKHYPNDQSHYILIDGHSRSNASELYCRSHIFPNANGKIEPLIFYPNPDYRKEKK